jgi:hypothetical protein
MSRRRGSCVTYDGYRGPSRGGNNCRGSTPVDPPPVLSRSCTTGLSALSAASVDVFWHSMVSVAAWLQPSLRAGASAAPPSTDKADTAVGAVARVSTVKHDWMRSVAGKTGNGNSHVGVSVAKVSWQSPNHRVHTNNQFVTQMRNVRGNKKPWAIELCALPELSHHDLRLKA